MQWIRKRRGGGGAHSSGLPPAPGTSPWLRPYSHQPAGDTDHIMQHALRAGAPGSTTSPPGAPEWASSPRSDQDERTRDTHLAVPGHQAAELDSSDSFPAQTAASTPRTRRAGRKMRVAAASAALSWPLPPHAPFPFPSCFWVSQPSSPSLPFSHRRNAHRKPSFIISFPCVLLKCMLAGEPTVLQEVGAYRYQLIIFFIHH